MGLKKKLMENYKEYMRDPKGQYFKNLTKMLNLHVAGKVTKEEVFEFVKKWYNEGK